MIRVETRQSAEEITDSVNPWGDINSNSWRFRAFRAEWFATAASYASSTELLDQARAALESDDTDRIILKSEALQRAVASGIIALSDGYLEEIGRVYEELSPYAGTASISLFVPYDRDLGLLAAALGRYDDAAQHFEASMELCRKGVFHPQLAWTQADYAEMLLDRDNEGDREKATTIQDEALAGAREMGMPPLVERILASRGILRASSSTDLRWASPPRDLIHPGIMSRFLNPPAGRQH